MLENGCATGINERCPRQRRQFYIGIGERRFIIDVMALADWTLGFQFAVSLPAQSGKVYRLEYKNSLNDTNWNAMPLQAGREGKVILSDPTVSDSRRFYRARWR